MEIARQTYTRLLGPESKLVVNTVNRLLGRVLVDSGDPGSAIPLLQGTVRFVEATEGPESPGLINPLDSLADALARLGRHPEALVIRRRALQIAVAADDPSLRPQEQCGVGADLLALGRPEVALPELESADQGYSLPAADGVDGAQCRLKLAEALHQLRREPKRVRSLTERARAILLGEDARNENHRYAEDIAEADRLLGDLITPVRRAR